MVEEKDYTISKTKMEKEWVDETEKLLRAVYKHIDNLKLRLNDIRKEKV